MGTPERDLHTVQPGGEQIEENKGLKQSCEDTVNQLCENLFKQGNIAVVYGASMGDEGKGKVATVLHHFKDLSWVAAPTGGGNAGHTVYVEGKKIALHELPGGATIQHAKVYLGQGRVIHLQGLEKEIMELKDAGVETKNRIYVAGGAHVIFKTIQKALDGFIEHIKGKNSVGTTKAGIGPAYALKAFRTSITINDLILNSQNIKDRLQTNFNLFASYAEGTQENTTWEQCEAEYELVRTRLLELVDAGEITVDKHNNILKKDVIDGKKVLVECSQSALLAVDGGFYPNVTSSDTTPNGVRSGLNIPQLSHTNIAVLKSIKSKVGNGPFPSKLPEDELTKHYRKETGEFGATTQRNRDLGRFDAVETRKVLTTHPTNVIVLTRLDDLHHMGTVKFAKGYINTETQEEFYDETPLENEYNDIEVEYSETYDVKENIGGLNSFHDLPDGYKNYVTDLINALDFKGEVYLGTGPNAGDMVKYEQQK